MVKGSHRPPKTITLAISQSHPYSHICSMVIKAQKTWECPLSKANSVCEEVEAEKNGSGCEVTRYVFPQYMQNKVSSEVV